NLAFAQELQDGWHVYWKNQGDSGLPLEFVWSLPVGAVSGGIDYPTPERIAIGPLVNFGHAGAPVFLTSIAAPKDAAVGSTLDIGLKATWLICADICVPETGAFSLKVPVVAAPEANAAEAALFERARAALPTPLPGEAYYSVNGSMLSLDAAAPGAAAAGYFFPATEGITEPAADQKFRKRAGRLHLSIRGGPALASLSGALDGVLVLETGGVEKGYAVAATRKDEPAGSAPGGSLGGLLLAAFFGGALLNLMPCVFPILFIKAAAMANVAAGDKSAMRRHGLLYALGVISTFAALGGLLLALRAGGAELGWGFHLQSPAVVALSAYVLFAVGLNLAGAFSIGSSVQNLGSDYLKGKSGDPAAFLTGVLAVVVAAPCVGPFLTAPIGAAALLPPALGLSIFIAMAAGLAAPYAALSFFPGARRLLPKPGAWMERFRQALSFPVFAAAAFFLWVLSEQTGGRGLALGLGGLLLVGLAARLWAWGGSRRWGAIAAVLALAAALVPVALVRPAAAEADAAGVIGFDPADIARRRAAGEAVFIDFTAAWCVTCQVNKLTVLAAPKVKAAFAKAGVARVVADWTNRDPVIEQALSEFGANGVPLYVYYPPGGEAVILPQPLTEKSVLTLFAEDSKGTAP
ncbi:MAG: thioredoxin family protein, partial [Parvularculaceae bacterium]|nr:thioredoxin family protein [Parvularculaceae bacterium]